MPEHQFTPSQLHHIKRMASQGLNEQQIAAGIGFDVGLLAGAAAQQALTDGRARGEADLTAAVERGKRKRKPRP